MADALAATALCALFGAFLTGTATAAYLLARDAWHALLDPDWQAEL